MYGSHRQQPQNHGCNDEHDPFLVVEEPSMMHGIHGQPPTGPIQPKTLPQAGKGFTPGRAPTMGGIKRVPRYTLPVRHRKEEDQIKARPITCFSTPKIKLRVTLAQGANGEELSPNLGDGRGQAAAT